MGVNFEKEEIPTLGIVKRFNTLKLKENQLCTYCDEIATEMDHVIPRSRFYEAPHDTVNYIVPSCKECNDRLSNHPVFTIKDRREFLNSKVTREVHVKDNKLFNGIEQGAFQILSPKGRKPKNTSWSEFKLKKEKIESPYLENVASFRTYRSWNE